MNCYINGELINNGEVAWDIWDSENVSTYLAPIFFTVSGICTEVIFFP